MIHHLRLGKSDLEFASAMSLTFRAGSEINDDCAVRTKITVVYDSC